MGLSLIEAMALMTPGVKRRPAPATPTIKDGKKNSKHGHNKPVPANCFYNTFTITKPQESLQRQISVVMGEYYGDTASDMKRKAMKCRKFSLKYLLSSLHNKLRESGKDMTPPF